MGYKRTYSNVTDGNISSYDYIDSILGIGYKRFYLSGDISDTGGTKTYFLNSQAIYSDADNYSLQLTSATNQTLDFDVTVASPFILSSSDAVFNFILRNTANSTSNITITVNHVRGSTVTPLGSKQTPNQSATTTAKRCVRIPLTTKAFSIGDKLRVSVKLTCVTYTTGATLIYFDALNRVSLTETVSGATVGLDFSCYLPFKLDL